VIVSADPAGSGFVASLPPGREYYRLHAHGSINSGKSLEMLREIAPSVRRGAQRQAGRIHVQSRPVCHINFLVPFEAAVRSLKVEPITALSGD
jgi:hypothetical protein